MARALFIISIIIAMQLIIAGIILQDGNGITMKGTGTEDSLAQLGDKSSALRQPGISGQLQATPINALSGLQNIVNYFVVAVNPLSGVQLAGEGQLSLLLAYLVAGIRTFLSAIFLMKMYSVIFKNEPLI